MSIARSDWRLPARLRKSVMVLHIISGIGWMGADVAIFLLLLTGLTTNDGETAAACYIAVGVFVPIAVPILSLSMLASGILLGWGTKWGLLRYWWVFVKLVIALTMTVLVFASLVPGINDLEVAFVTGASADSVRDSTGSAREQLMYPPIVSFLLLGFAVILSIFKPWKRTPWADGRGSRSVTSAAARLS